METPQQAAAATVRRRMRPTEALRRRLTDAPPLRGVVMKNRIMLQKKNHYFYPCYIRQNHEMESQNYYASRRIAHCHANFIEPGTLEYCAHI
jgi:hypothetical protein